MTANDDPLEKSFAALRRAHSVPDVDVGLERKLIREMNAIPARRRRRRMAIAAALGISVFSLAGGVYAAGGLEFIRHWLGDVRAIEVHVGPDGEPTVLMRNDAGDVIGRGRLPPADEDGNYRAWILPDDE